MPGKTAPWMILGTLLAMLVVIGFTINPPSKPTGQGGSTAIAAAPHR
jgi:hypothetical protein